jgi:CheY-like chemotaxis protein
MPERRTILVADVPTGRRTVQNVVGPEVAVVEADTVREAVQHLQEGVDAVACGLHFDSSGMFDLLRLAKADDLTRGTPFLCFRDLDSEFGRPLLESLSISCVAVGATGFVDLFHLKTQYGLREADARFRQALLGLLDGAR